MAKITSHIPAAYVDGYNPDEDVVIPTGACVWCGQPTPVMAETPFRPDLGAVPLMLTCGAQVIRAYRALQEGRQLTAEEQAGLARLASR